MERFLGIRNLGVKFRARSGAPFGRRRFFAVRHISLDIRREETFCLVGESGAGKTTLIRAILGLHPFHEGELEYEGRTIARSNDGNHRKLVSDAQMVFQDPAASLSPFLTLGRSIEEPLRAKGVGRKERAVLVERLAEQTGLSLRMLRRTPREVSGGQNQRACIARALSTRPRILFLDEPLATLDAVIHKQMIELLRRVKSEHGLTFFLVTHDLGLVKRIGTTVAVMYMGRIVEKSRAETFFSHPCHPYSRALLSSVLTPGVWKGERVVLKGEMPSPRHPPSGCVFHSRCFRKLPVCETAEPPRRVVGPGHEVHCHLY